MLQLPGKFGFSWNIGLGDYPPPPHCLAVRITMIGSDTFSCLQWWRGIVLDSSLDGQGYCDRSRVMAAVIRCYIISYLVGVVNLLIFGALIVMIFLFVVMSLDRSLVINSLLSLELSVLIDINLDCCKSLMYCNLFVITILVRVSKCISKYAKVARLIFFIC